MAALCTLLDDRGVVSVTGADAVSFVDNLVTNAVDTLDEGEARFAALLTPQGKIAFEFFAVRSAAGFLLDTRRERAADLAKRLGMYRLRAKVEIADLSAASAVAAVWWPDGNVTSFGYAGDLRASFADPRDPRLGVRLLLARDADTPPLRDLVGATLASPASYLAERLARCIPEGGTDYTLGETFPHEANYDLINGVSFSKGCFVGQEVVARMQNKTVIRKRVVRLAGAGLRTGAEVKTGDAVIGSVGSTATTTALALVRLDRAAEALDRAQLVTVEGAAVTVDPEAIARYRQSVLDKPVIDL
jgi:hypothetical protein